MMSTAAIADEKRVFDELALVKEFPVVGMPNGNLSGLARCGADMWTVSDRDDDRIYRLDIGTGGTLQALVQSVEVPDPPQVGLPLKLRLIVQAARVVRGGWLDFEGISCDANGTRYVVSESTASVLAVPANGSPYWLPLPQVLTDEARAAGLLQNFNEIYEGVTVDPSGDRLWLAAEQHRRGLVHARRKNGEWRCEGRCVLLSEGGGERSAPGSWKNAVMGRNFAGLAFYEDKLYTLERLTYRICRRNASTGEVERCWSFARDALTEPRRYTSPAAPEALVIDDDGAWVGIDNNGVTRADGEARPIVMHFATPEGGWSGAK